MYNQQIILYHRVTSSSTTLNFTILYTTLLCLNQTKLSTLLKSSPPFKYFIPKPTSHVHQNYTTQLMSTCPRILLLCISTFLYMSPICTLVHMYQRTSLPIQSPASIHILLQLYITTILPYMCSALYMSPICTFRHMYTSLPM